ARSLRGRARDPVAGGGAWPLGDCSPSSGERAGGDHHATGRVAEDRKDLERERAAEAEPRLDRRADDDQLGAVVARHLGELAPEGALTGADDPSGGGDAVRLGDGGCVRERGLERLGLTVEV